jgi:hypothetical protein
MKTKRFMRFNASANATAMRPQPATSARNDVHAARTHDSPQEGERGRIQRPHANRWKPDQFASLQAMRALDRHRFLVTVDEIPPSVAGGEP